MDFWKGPRMNTALKYAFGALLPTLFASQAMACYTVYNRNNQVLYHALAAPVDMRYQLHQTLPAVYPGGHMVFSITDTNCPAVNERSATRVSTVNSLTRRESYVEGPSAAPARTAKPSGPSGNR
jgi:hypothetical protein